MSKKTSYKNTATTSTTADRAVTADEIGEPINSLLTGEKLREKGLCPLVLVRTAAAGVHVGYMASINAQAQIVELVDCNRIWSWSGANELYEVATAGIDMQGSRVSEHGRQIVLPFIEIHVVSDQAVKSLTTSRWS